MRLVLAILLCGAVPARAFLFGVPSEKKAVSMLNGMRDSFARGDCASVMDTSSGFLIEKPAANLREEAYGYMGRCYEAGGATDKAISLYKLASGLYPANSLFALRLALIYNKAGFFGNAVPLFLKVLNTRSDDMEANLGLARSYAALGFYSRAKTYYSRAAIFTDFSDAAALREYAFCMLKKRDWNEALYIAGRGAKAEPGSASWSLVEARVMAGKGDYSKAVEAVDKAIDLEPSRRLRLERALYLLLGGLPERAAAAADAELAADKGDPLASEVKGMALYALKRKDEAAVYFKIAAKGGPFTARIADSFLGGKVERPEGSCEK